MLLSDGEQWLRGDGDKAEELRLIFGEASCPSSSPVVERKRANEDAGKNGLCNTGKTRVSLTCMFVLCCFKHSFAQGGFCT